MRKFGEFIFSLYLRDVECRWAIYKDRDFFADGGVMTIKARRPFMFAYNFRYGEPNPETWCYVKQRKVRRAACRYDHTQQEVDAWWDGVVLSRSLGSEHLKPGSKRGI
jgi:hypothetical protein